MNLHIFIEEKVIKIYKFNIIFKMEVIITNMEIRMQEVQHLPKCEKL